MARINHVYNAVQILMNKNHLGVLTPERFNELCRKAQNNLYSNLLNERRIAYNRRNANRGGQRKEEIDKALARYLVRQQVEVVNGIIQIPDNFGFFPDQYLYTVNNRHIEKMGNDNYGYCFTPIVAPTETYPQHKVDGGNITIFPDSITEVVMIYYRTPNIPNWTYISVNGKALFNVDDTDFVDVDVYEHRTDDLIMDIYKSAALHIKDQLGVQVETAEDRDEQNKDAAV